ncbi:hypothetical protein [Streptomyces uncialis]|uniref:hypothetical protein n=1 Tax=Streptomyces uncialis TaxID=1048205 RepID=UPI002257A32E|nr:hypothetical protein [Streptomyces uncialis]MCX4664714.1 hypothetical protein [Streptomyces uncialis]
MPHRFRWSAEMGPQLEEWVVQGVARLGAEAVRERAAFWRGYRLLSMSRLVTEELTARHRAMFPSVQRLEAAETRATGLLWGVPATGETRARKGAARVDGVCPCGGSGWVAVWDEFGDPDLSFDLMCPVHGRTGCGARNGAGL